MIDLNTFEITGLVGFIEQKTTANNTPIVNIVVYVSDDYKEQTGDWVNRSHRLMVSFFGPRCDGIFKVFKAKDRVWVRGKITTAEHDDSGKKTTSIYFRGEEIGKLVSGGVDVNQPAATTSKNPAPAAKSPRPKSSWSKSKAPADDDIDLDDLLDSDDDESSPL